jgi:photosystem II stability/assembly factor-like uncharacterized protein
MARSRPLRWARVDGYTYRFIDGCVTGDGQLFVAAEDRHLLEQGQPHTVFGVYADGQWHEYATRPDWTALGMTAVRPPDGGPWRVLVLGPGGQLCELSPPPERKLTPLPSIPGHIGMTWLTTADGAVYAGGMGRELLRRELDGSWTDLSAPRKGPEEDLVHFGGLAASTSGELYAVGDRGEIWVRTDAGWRREDSPTREQLGGISPAGDGRVYILGAEGTLLHGRRSAWKVVDLGMREDWRALCEHQGALFLSTDSQVFQRTDGGRLVALEYDGDEELEDTACRVLLSVGDLGLCSIKSGGVFRWRADGGWDRLA